MTSTLRNVLILGVATVVAAGVGAYVLLPAPVTEQPGQAPSLAMPPEAAPAPLPAAPGDDAAAQARQKTLEAETITFVTRIKPFTVLRDTPVYLAASEAAPQMYSLKAGSALISADASNDGKWIIALTVDGQAAYLKSQDLGPYQPPAAASELAEVASVAGAATVIDTATLRVDGQQISLAGIRGLGEPYAQQVQKLVDGLGGRVACVPKQAGYVCTLPNGADLARVALFNGIADASDDASTDYRNQAETARVAQKGHWAPGNAAP